MTLLGATVAADVTTLRPAPTCHTASATPVAPVPEEKSSTLFQTPTLALALVSVQLTFNSLWPAGRFPNSLTVQALAMAPAGLAITNEDAANMAATSNRRLLLWRIRWFPPT